MIWCWKSEEMHWTEQQLVPWRKSQMCTHGSSRWLTLTCPHDALHHVNRPDLPRYRYHAKDVLRVRVSCYPLNSLVYSFINDTSGYITQELKHIRTPYSSSSDNHPLYCRNKDSLLY